jgi:CBS-domain-containing membrane protein
MKTAGPVNFGRWVRTVYLGVGDAWGDNAAPTADIARLLLNRRIGALPVLKDEKVVGMITEADMIRALIDLEEAQDM